MDDTHKLNSILEDFLPVAILCVELLQEPFALFCKTNKQTEKNMHLDLQHKKIPHLTDLN